MGQGRLSDFGFNKEGLVFKRDKSPVKALCSSCGKQKWLNWVAGRKHLCDECKQFMTE